MTNFKNNKQALEFLNLVNKKKFQKIIIVTGKNSLYKSEGDKLISLIHKNKNINFFFKKSKFPEINELKKLVLFIEKLKPDLIIAIGGGAVIDYSKIANIVDIKNFETLEKKITKYITPGSKKRSILIAIPTTAGSGAETTSNAVIYIDKIKYSVESQLLLPDYFFLINQLIFKNPTKLKSSSGFDAIAQSIESLLSLKSNSKSVIFAKKSLILTNKNYLSFVKKPTNLNSNNMLIAANLSGKAINISKTTAPHAVSYPFTSIYGINHGHAVSLTLEKFLMFNFRNMHLSKSEFSLKNRYKILFDLFKVQNISDLCIKIKKIKKEANLVDDFKKLGVNLDKNIDRILDGINLLRVKNNPVQINEKDIKEILYKI
mgnify:CR=1 FL=1